MLLIKITKTMSSESEKTVNVFIEMKIYDSVAENVLGLGDIIVKIWRMFRQRIKIILGYSFH